MNLRPLRLLALAALLPACAVVRSSFTRPDYAAHDRDQTVRLRIAVAPLPNGLESVGKLWAQVARKAVNDKRDFIARTVAVGTAAAQAPCEEGIQGVLRLEPKVTRQGGGVNAEVRALLQRCDGTVIWSAEAGGSFDASDSLYTETAATYAEKLGEEVRPYVGAAHRLLLATLETLPQPRLDDAGIEEKIELAE